MDTAKLLENSAPSYSQGTRLLFDNNSLMDHNSFMDNGFLDGNIGRDPESLNIKNYLFYEDCLRKAFLRKVYLILFTQLSVTFAFVAGFVACLCGTSICGGTSGTLVVGAAGHASADRCNGRDSLRTWPMNFICLGIFTVAESFLVAVVASVYDGVVVLLAIRITATICLALIEFAMQTKYDFTAWGAFLLSALVCLLVLGLAAIFLDSRPAAALRLWSARYSRHKFIHGL